MGKGLGILSTVLVQRGALRQGDHVVAGQSWGKVRLLLDEEGAQLSEAGPAVPVRVSGMRVMPRAGDELLVVPSEARAKEVVEFRLLRADAQALAAAAPRRGRKGGGAKLLPALLKAESFGSLEAAREGLSHFPSTRVELKLVREGVGPVTESDVQLAQSVGAQVIAFNVPLESKAAGLAATLQVPVHSHSIIYALVDAAKAAIEPVVEARETGQAEVLEVFTLTLNRKDRAVGMSKHTAVAGSRVTDGQASAGSAVRVVRGGEVTQEGDVISLKHFKQEVRTMKKGSECGLILRDYADLQSGDTIQFYELISRRPSLYEEQGSAK
ncbi:hypothetical protein EMIHUDRAFT_371788 [Emiliania huxleyi CCMP1516]|uniref:Translation initiation factor IF- 2 domain-containing protein n=2 Tax=Emiliania huxleyi TaxID=2903 RepID=A0A0D3IF69_EMIH1|nr:hypothetical protein EMIHUDRAFT_371788 [Emiliania huxleyi CCMP1516]EOD09904.1 hypothetical protein EMIHUDRAFT_371788 [Emiliania huxleyi CCMP1516]|eukprot:XP_005762333.1 hypothetical protein EMIHUDRAFT_371788 [Emiliania huxleyi CCMP1516]